MRIDTDECVQCGQCCSTEGISGGGVSGCPTGALHLDPKGWPVISESLCVNCGRCPSLCGLGAIVEDTCA